MTFVTLLKVTARVWISSLSKLFTPKGFFKKTRTAILVNQQGYLVKASQENKRLQELIDTHSDVKKVIVP